MLVLSRKPDTAIRIGANIEVKVLSIRNRQVKLGIDAPHSIRIWRNELCCGDPRLLGDERPNTNAEHRVQARQT